MSLQWAKAWRTLTAGEEPDDALDHVVRSMDEIERASRETDVRLKRIYARRLLGLLRWQFVATNVVFFGYAVWGVKWNIPAQVISAWIAATVVELIGVVAVVTAYLFPRPPKRDMT